MDEKIKYLKFKKIIWCIISEVLSKTMNYLLFILYIIKYKLANMTQLDFF